MTYYILLSEKEDMELIRFDSRILGNTTLTKKFYIHEGFHILSDLINKNSKYLETIRIFDENNKSYTIEQFFNFLKSHTIIYS